MATHARHARPGSLGRGWYGPHQNQYGCPTLEEKLWDQIDGPWVEGVEWYDCWFFTGAWRSRYGYGRVRQNGRSRQAHVVAFETFFGKLAPGHEARHACDMRLCCNPFHIAPGTHLENERDKWDKEFAWASTPLGYPPDVHLKEYCA